MSQQKLALNVKISSSLSTAVFECGIYSLLFIQRQLSSSTWWNIAAAPARKPCVRSRSLPISTLLSNLYTGFKLCSADYKILSLTYKVLTTTQPSYLYNFISVQPHRSTRSSDVVILFRPPSSSSLKVNNRSFRHASLCLWNNLSRELRLPADHEDLSLLSDLTHVSSSLPSSPLSPSITPYLFHSRLKTHLFHKSFPPQFFYFSTHRTDSVDSICFSFFSGMSVLTLAL